MNKYQEALDEIVEDLINCGQIQDLPGESRILRWQEVGLLKELVDQNFTHILKVKKVGYPPRIAFRTSEEAREYARKHDLKGCTLESIQFGKELE